MYTRGGARQEELIHNLAEGLYQEFKIPGLENVKSLDTDRIVKIIKDKLPGLNSNLKLKDSKRDDTCRKIINIYRNNLGMNIPQSVDSNEGCEYAFEFLNTVITKVCGDYTDMRFLIHDVVTKASVALDFIKSVDQEILQRLKDANKDSSEGMENLSSYENLKNEMTDYLQKLMQLLAESASIETPSEKDFLDAILRDKSLREFRRLLGIDEQSIKQEDLLEKEADKLSHMFHKLKLTAYIANSISKALNKVGLSLSEFEKAKSSREIESLAEKHMKKLDSAEKLQDFFNALNTLKRHFHSELKESAVKELREKKGSRIDGGAREKKYEQKIRRQERFKEQITVTFSHALRNHFDKLHDNNVHLIEDANKGLIKMSDRINNFKYSLEALNEATKTRGLALYLIEYVNLPSDKQIKRNFLDALQHVIASARQLDSPDSKALQNLVQICEAIIADVDQYTSSYLVSIGAPASTDFKLQNVPKEGGEPKDDLYKDNIPCSVPSETSGGSGSNPNLEELIEKTEIITNRPISIEHTIKQIIWVLMVSRLDSRMKFNAERLKEYEKDFEETLGKYVAKKKNSLKQWRADKLQECKDFNEKQKENAQRIIECVYDTKFKFWDAAEAIEIYLKTFADTMINNPQDAKELISMINDPKLNIDWYAKSTGQRIDELFGVFDAQNSKPADLNEGNAVLYDYPKRQDTGRALPPVPGQNIPPAPLQPPILFGQSEHKHGGAIRYPVNADNFKELEKKARLSMDGLEVLKNIINVFDSIGRKIGQVELKEKTFLPLVSVWKNLKQYLYMSFFRFGFDDKYNNQADSYLPSNGSAANSDLRYKNSYAVLVATLTYSKQSYSPDRLISDVRDIRDNMSLVKDRISSLRKLENPTPNETTELQTAEQSLITLRDELNNKKNELNNNRTIDPMMYKIAKDRDFYDEDNLFTKMIKAMVKKIFTVLGIYDMKHRQTNFDDLYNLPLRTIVGGSAGINSSPEILEEAIELYVRIPLLMEYYRDLFFKDNHFRTTYDEKAIGFLPEFQTPWKELIKLVFDDTKNLKGEYTDYHARIFISEINKLYAVYKKLAPSNTVNAVIYSFIDEINNRYGLIKTKVLSDYISDKRSVRQTLQGSANDPDRPYHSSYPTLGDEDDEYRKAAPSDVYSKEVLPGSDPLSEQKYKADDYDYFTLVKEFRDQLKSSLTHSDSMPSREFTEIIKQIKKDVKLAMSTRDKYDLISKSIQTTNKLSNINLLQYFVIHETFLTSLNTLMSIDQKFKKLVDAFSKLDTDLIKSLAKESRDRGNVDYITALLAAQIDGKLKNVNSDTWNNQLNTAPAQPIQLSALAVNNDNILNAANSNAVYDILVPNGSRDLLLVWLVDLLSDFGNSDLTQVQVTKESISLDVSRLLSLVESQLVNARSLLLKFRPLLPSNQYDLYKNQLDQLDGSIYYGVFKEEYISQDERKLGISWMSKVLNSLWNWVKVQPNLLNGFLQLVVYRIVGISSAPPSSFRQFGLGSVLHNKLFVLLGPEVENEVLTIKPALRVALGIPASPGGPPSVGPVSIIESYNKGHPEDVFLTKSLFKMFNHLIYKLLELCYDSSSNKLYFPLFSELVNGPLYNSVFSNGAFPDLTSNDNAGGGVYAPLPKSNSLLVASLAQMLNRLAKQTIKNKDIKIFIANSLAEVSSVMKENYAAGLPYFIKLFKHFLKRCSLIKEVAVSMSELRHNIPAGSPMTPLNLDQLEDLDFPHENIPTNYNHAGLSNDLQDSDKNRTYLLDCIKFMEDSIISLMNSVKSVYNEVSDSYIPFELYPKFNETYKDMNKKNPMLLYSTAEYLANPSNKLREVILPQFFDRSKASFKYYYGSRKLVTTDSPIGLKEVAYLDFLVDKFNNSHTQYLHLEKPAVNDLVKNNVDLLRFNTDLFYNNYLSNNAYSASNLNPDWTSLNNQLLSYQLKNNIEPVVGLIENSFQQTSIDTLVKDYTPLSMGSSDRSITLIKNIVDLNVMPINIHSLRRDIPFAHIYNYAISFDDMIDHMQKVGKIATSLYENPPLKQREFHYMTNFLKDPYQKINKDDFVREVVPILLGVGDVPMSRPKFLSDQMWVNILGQKPIDWNSFVAKENFADLSIALPETFVNQDKLYRFDTILIRNIMFLSNMQRFIRHKLRSKLLRIVGPIVSGVPLISEEMTEISSQQRTVPGHHKLQKN